ncbi:DUF202 domain-containing protein [Actinokineospora bangkokensis]|uniref:DUF202 domain-containing protein n=1 Tax=Actinokineospora bangkokensis TaxID=1193682 RepID=A0A1Q9LBQ7_9PSEU|nr:DUF202 domain-containing protein [Actinokineospora bangkokensis]OLR89435.1 hypothetical protein BJP25_04925 [Actinokineospora bangkokensis]
MTGPDRGLQAERTRLAWSRTAFAAAVLGTLLTHSARGPFALVAGLCSLLVPVVVLGLGVARYRHVRRAVAGGSPATTPGVQALLLVVVLVPAFAALLIVLSQ